MSKRLSELFYKMEHLATPEITLTHEECGILVDTMNSFAAQIIHHTDEIMEAHDGNPEDDLFDEEYQNYRLACAIEYVDPKPEYEPKGESEESEFEDGLESVELCIDVRKFDMYDEFAGGEKSFIVRAGADLNFEATVKRYSKNGALTRSDFLTNGGGNVQKITRLLKDGHVECEITLREIVEGDLE